MLEKNMRDKNSTVKETSLFSFFKGLVNGGNLEYSDNIKLPDYLKDSSDKIDRLAERYADIQEALIRIPSQKKSRGATNNSLEKPSNPKQEERKINRKINKGTISKDNDKIIDGPDL